MRNGTPAAGRLEVLRAIPLFRACSDRELAQVEALVDDIEIGASETLVREGTWEAESFVIVSGEAAVTISGRPVATLRAGDFFGEMAMLDRSARSATVTALTPMHLLVLGPRSFPALVEIGSVARSMLRDLVDRLRRTDEELVAETPLRL